MGVFPNMEEMVAQWSNRDQYSADLKFLQDRVWPYVKTKHLAHDSYCCDMFEHTKCVPTRDLMDGWMDR